MIDFPSASPATGCLAQGVAQWNPLVLCHQEEDSLGLWGCFRLALSSVFYGHAQTKAASLGGCLQIPFLSINPCFPVPLVSFLEVGYLCYFIKILKD